MARSKYAFALKDQQRQSDLVAKNFISASRFDDSKQGAGLTGLQIGALEQDLKRIAGTLGGSVDAPVDQHPSYRAALAELGQAKLDLARVEVRASLPGTVSRSPKPGLYVTTGSMAMAVVVSGNLWVEANFTEPISPMFTPDNRSRSILTPIPTRSGKARWKVSARPPALSSR